MKIYFTCSARGMEEYGENYKMIYNVVLKLGHQHVDDYKTESDPLKVYHYSDTESVELYKRTVASMNRCDIVLLEVSKHSLTMGYLIQRSLELGKPVIALHVNGKAPVFVSGIQEDKLQVVEYDLNSLDKVLNSAIIYASELMDTRFNFFISPKIGNYLDWVAKKKKLPRAVYLRRLIEEDMKQNEEYQG